MSDTAMPVPATPERDDELEAELRRAAQLFDPVPARLVAFAMEAFEWRTIDGDLAELVFDSLAATGPTPVRGDDQSRLLTFSSPEVSVEVEIAPPGPARQITGRLVPAFAADIEIRTIHRNVTVPADSLGRFSAVLPGGGPVRFTCQRTDDAATRPVFTDWIAA
jgi:hypothetical protein